MAATPPCVSLRAPKTDVSREEPAQLATLRGRGRRVLHAVVVLAVVSALLPLAFGPGRAYATTPSITDYITSGGDQVVTVPNGTYTGGSVVAPHPATSGPYKG